MREKKPNNTNLDCCCRGSRYENHGVQRTFSMTVRILEKNLRLLARLRCSHLKKVVSLTMSSSHRMSKNIHMRSATKQSCVSTDTPHKSSLTVTSVVLVPPPDRWMKDTHFVDVSWCQSAPAERLRPAAASAPPSGMLLAALTFPASLDSWPWERHLTPQMFVCTTAAVGTFSVFKHIWDGTVFSCTCHTYRC